MSEPPLKSIGDCGFESRQRFFERITFTPQADHGVDLRNHAPERTWDEGYVDN